MPGIFGYYDPQQRLPESTLDRMAQTLWASATDHYAIERSTTAAFGIVNYAGAGLIEGGAAARYAVLGHLDAFSPDGSGSPHMPTDIAQRCLGAGRISGIEQIRGSFAAVVLNHAKGTVTLVTDRFASRPVYVLRHENIWYFASQIKAILAVLPRAACIDQESVATMLAIGEVVGNRTLVSDVSTLPAASVMILSAEGATHQRYWQYIYEQNPQCNWHVAIDRAGATLTQAVAREIYHGKSVAIPLSGGLDSRFALDLAGRLGASPRAYTWGVSGCRDIRYAQQVASRLGCQHETFIFDEGYLATLAERGVWLTEGHTPATNFHVLPYVDTLASKGHDILLDGFAGDVVLGGNFISDAWMDSSDFSAAGAALWLWRRKGFSGDWHHPAMNDLQQMGNQIFVESYREYPGQTPMDAAMAFLIDNRLRRVTTCGTEIFRSRMPVRQPFMDADFIDAIRTLPHDWRKRHKFYLEVLKKFAPVSAAAPYQRTMLPATVPFWMNWFSLAAQKGYDRLSSRWGFPELMKGKSPSNFPSWFRGVLRPYAEGILLSARTLDRGVLPVDAVRNAVRQHMDQGRDLSSLIGAMLSVEVFCRLFLDDLPGSVSRFSVNGPNQPPRDGS